MVTQICLQKNDHYLASNYAAATAFEGGHKGHPVGAEGLHGDTFTRG